MALILLEVMDIIISTLHFPKMQMLLSAGTIDFIKTISKNTALLYSGRLYIYLTEINALAKEMLENLTRNMAKNKVLQMYSKLVTKWLGQVGAINNVKACTKEVVLSELIYN